MAYYQYQTTFRYGLFVLVVFLILLGLFAWWGANYFLA